MPFTFSHPALALPLYFLRKRYFSVTGLVMGSIAPDFEYFIRMKKGPSLYSHSIGAIFWFNLPVALLLAFIFHGIVKMPLIHNLPHRLSVRFRHYENCQWLTFFRHHWSIVLFSIILGTASHLLWDWFTHYSVVFTNGNRKIEGSFFNQYFSIYTYTIIHIINSLVGLAILFIGIMRLPVNDNGRLKQRGNWYWPKILVLTILFVAGWSVLFPIRLIDDLVTIVISAFLIAVTLFSFLHKVKFQKQHY